jgi:hypothetical protein
MRPDKLIAGESYRHKDHPDYCWAKVIKVLKPKEAENTHNRIVVKCEWSQNKNDSWGLIKYFKPSDLVDV